MLSRFRGSLTYANVMSTIAVVGVLAGGTAYAANTVFSTTSSTAKSGIPTSPSTRWAR